MVSSAYGSLRRRGRGLRAAAVLVLGFALAPPPALADDGAAAALLARLAERDWRVGAFSQRIEDESGTVVEESAGSYALLRPGRLRWEVHTPDDQLIVLEDGVLWHYDRDLGSATRRSLDGERELLPLQALNGDGALLRERFGVERLAGTAADEERYRLTPRDGGAGFESLSATFRDSALVRLTIIDGLSQRIVIELQPDMNASEPAPTLFRFNPPPGTDVFDDGR